jgi:NADH:ubiquinone oxidoreductase subunit 4 (subunit M)
MTVVLIVPRASPEMLRIIALLALGTAVYGAALALVQTSARRACGYLFMSQSALVMAGLDCTSVTALAGGLLVWLSAGLAFAGLARCVLVLEARRWGSRAPAFQERSASSVRNCLLTAPWTCSRSWDSPLSSRRR